MRAKTGRVVRVTVASKLAEFKDKLILRKLVDKSASWDAFLKNNGITLNDEEHCISALMGRVIATTKDKVSKVIDQYARKVPVYKVWIVENIPEYLDQQGSQESMSQRASSRKKKPTKRLVSEDEEPVDLDDIDVEGAVDNDDCVFTVPEARLPPRSYGGWTDRVETASIATQDSLDARIDENMKEDVIAKIRNWATNGDLYRLREELRSLEANRNNLKVARYIPYTMNVLGVLFGTN